MRLTTKDGTILNPRFVREIRFNSEDAPIAVGENGCLHELDQFSRYEELNSVFDPRLSSDPTIEDL